MTDSMYLRLKSLNTRTVRGVTSPKNIVRVAAMHNLREIAAELGATAASGINPGRMNLNYILRGPDTAAGVADLAMALLKNAGVESLRRDACMSLELVVSVPADSAVDHREYFAAAVAWADAYFNVPILSAAVHLDEAAPHCHILLLPLVAGRMQGGALAGGPAKIRAMLADFQSQVAQRFGLTHQTRAKRLSKLNRDMAGRVVLDALRARPERLQDPAMRDALIAGLGSQAVELLALLGLSMPSAKPKPRSFADIMTAPCKPERTRRAVLDTKYIDVAQNLGSQDGGKFDNVYLCVDVAPALSPNPAHEQPHQSAQGMQDSLRTSAPAADEVAVGGVLKVEETPVPAASVQAATSVPPGGVRNFTDTPQAVHHLDTPEPVDAHHQPGVNDRASHSTQIPGVLGRQHSPENSCQLDVSTSARISSLLTGQAKSTDCVALIDCQAKTTRPVPCVDGMRTHKDPSISGRISQGGGVSPPPAGVPNFGQTPSSFGDTPSTGGEVLKTEQVDQQAGHVSARRRSCKGGAGIAPPPASPDHRAAGDYQRQRDDKQPSDAWCSDLGEFVQATGPPASADP